MPRKSKSPPKSASKGAKKSPPRKGVKQPAPSSRQSTPQPLQVEPPKTPTVSSSDTLKGLNLPEVENNVVKATMTAAETSPLDPSLSDSSNLSSPPSDIGKTPVGLVSPEKRSSIPVVAGDGSPVRRSLRKRKAPDRMNEAKDVSLSRKRRKISDSSNNSGDVVVPPAKKGGKNVTNTTDNVVQSVEQSPNADQPITSSPISTNSNDDAAALLGDDGLPKSVSPAGINQDPAITKSEPTSEEKRIIRQFQKKMGDMLHDGAIHPRWPEFKANQVIMYAADATTISTPDQVFDSPSPSPAKRNIRGGARGGGRGGSNGRGRGNGRGGRGGAVPPGKGRDESQEPAPKQVSTEEEQNAMRVIRKRQAELRQFFHQVGGQQRDILDQLATRDLNRLSKKAKAHKQVPEYDELIEELILRRMDTEELIRQEYEIKKAQAIKEMDMEKEMIEQNYRRHIEQVKEEHIRGAAGDIALFKNAHASKADDTYTQSGSEVDYFPYYHEIPEADSHVRGYLSSRITDERPLRVNLPSFDDLAKRDVIEDEVTRPVIESIQKDYLARRAEMDRKNSEHRAEELRKKTQNMTALTEEAEKQLDEMKGYLIPRPFREPQEQQYALSRLADMADYMRGAYPNQQYIYMPLPPDVKFPKEALSFKTVPNDGHLFPQPMPALAPVLTPRSQQTPVESSLRPTQQPTVESSMRSTQQPPELPQSAPDSTVRPSAIGSSGPHRQIAMKPLLSQTMYPRPPSSDQARRASLRSLAPQPAPPPPQPYLSHHHPQQYTFVTPQQPPQSAQFVGPPIYPLHHHHRHTSSTTTTANGVITTGPVNGSTNRINARSRSTSLVAPALTMAAQQTKIPMQFVNSTPESARQKAAAQAAAASAGANGNGNGSGKGRTLLPKP